MKLIWQTGMIFTLEDSACSTHLPLY